MAEPEFVDLTFEASGAPPGMGRRPRRGKGTSATAAAVAAAAAAIPRLPLPRLPHKWSASGAVLASPEAASGPRQAAAVQGETRE